MTTIQEIRRRWRAESPDIFKKLRFYCLTGVWISGIIVTMDAMDLEFLKNLLPQLLKPYFDEVIRWAFIISGTGAIFSKIPVKNPHDLVRPGDSPNSSV
jgi:hypothetical protein